MSNCKACLELCKIKNDPNPDFQGSPPASHEVMGEWFRDRFSDSNITPELLKDVVEQFVEYIEAHARIKNKDERVKAIDEFMFGMRRRDLIELDFNGASSYHKTPEEVVAHLVGFLQHDIKGEGLSYVSIVTKGREGK